MGITGGDTTVNTSTWLCKHQGVDRPQTRQRGAMVHRRTVGRLRRIALRHFLMLAHAVLLRYNTYCIDPNTPNRPQLHKQTTRSKFSPTVDFIRPGSFPLSPPPSKDLNRLTGVPVRKDHLEGLPHQRHI
jgi:hypothetical protein